MNKRNSLFRKEALEKVSSPEQLDQLIRVTSPGGWIALMGVLLFLLGILAWSIWGKLQTVNISPCILYPVSGSPSRVSSDKQGTVAQIFIPKNSFVHENDPLLSLEPPSKSNTPVTQSSPSKEQNIIVDAPMTGQVLDHYVSVGQFISPGQPLFSIQPMGAINEPLIAHVFISPQQGKWIKNGMEVLVSLDQLDPDRYGYIKGVVLSVSPYPRSELGLMRILQNEYLATLMSQYGAPFEAYVELKRDSCDPTGYAWTMKNPDRTSISSGSVCKARIVIEETRPIQLILPQFKLR